MTESSVEANLQRQSDEIQALSSIYGNDWHILDANSKKFSIHVAANSISSPRWEINLQVRMPHDYPLQSPPEYQIDAVWLRGEERLRLEDQLSQVYCDNIGEDIVYLWVEAVREFLQQKSDAGTRVNDDVLKVTEQNAVDCIESTPLFDEDQSFSSHSDHLRIPAKVSPLETCPEIIHGAIITDRKSTFQPHMALVTDKSQVKVVLNKLLENKKIANATHNMLAYRIVTGTGVVYHGCDDDGETHAGSRMLHLLEIMNVENVMVVVSRWYGGIQLGPDRFKHINNCCRQILESNGFSDDKDGKKVSKKDKKSR
ncbi:protein IMPACT-B-like isoform X1 [Biomphalaria glabrata]|uniref:Protein IMPACT-B-like isoform X1 n=2 Tax=Biomphalaria glabrata TaxID=6526 RepID=A0A9W3AZG3_BIOGL|nr:protein IMPACT-B-like isoform X1 [Biomphalaria glabrata]